MPLPKSLTDLGVHHLPAADGAPYRFGMIVPRANSRRVLAPCELEVVGKPSWFHRNTVDFLLEKGFSFVSLVDSWGPPG